MNISYLITTSNETDTLRNLLQRVSTYRGDDDEIVVMLDADCQNNELTRKIIQEFNLINYRQYTRSLNKDYSEQKNYGARQCTGKYIFQIDADELPEEALLINVNDFIVANPTIEAFWIPRINDFRGVTEEHAKHWGWKLSISPKYGRPLVNWPDPQCRLFLNEPERIKWVGRLHERIEGNKNYVFLPADEDLALYHDKTIEKQVDTNLKYNKNFTVKENQGFKVPK